MTWIVFAIFGIAIALWLHSQTVQDEITKVLDLTLASVSLIIGLAIAPLSVKGIGLVTLLTYPICSPSGRIFTPDCPRYCLLRRHCRSQQVLANLDVHHPCDSS